MNDSKFLDWLAERLINHYGEDEEQDFVRRTKQIADRLKFVENKADEFAWDFNND